ncbi:MAG: polysaccharide pyruvyl transferase family protein [Bacteroidaceae bacterium]|nr:polysaccharide pyruvyl transferase family protein [Bacteroidaceae bacterium]
MNYGAVLHSFAFQKILSDRGVESIVIDYVPNVLKGYNLKYPILNDCNIFSPIRFIYHLCNWSLGFKSNVRKFNKFNRFYNSYLKKTKLEYKYADLAMITSIEGMDFSTFICESDVIWKLYDDNLFDRGFLLDFPAAKGKKKVAYAPSLGNKPFPPEQLLFFKERIAEFDVISCREAQGAKYLSEILGSPIEWVLDPTLLLSDEDYSRLAIKPQEDNYLLIYNCMHNDQQMVHEAEKYANKVGLKVVEISNYSINKILNNHKVITDAGIEEWLGYFKYASFVVCNAFHGFCFSVLFKKEVFLFQRDDSDTRMLNITKALRLESRLVDSLQKKIPATFNQIDYDAVYVILENLRKKSMRFIQKHIIDY